MDNATKEIRDLADMFGWNVHSEESRRQDTLIHGQYMITVDYAVNGAVRDGKLYEFSSIASPAFREQTRSAHKRGDVKNWIVQLGH